MSERIIQNPFSWNNKWGESRVKRENRDLCMPKKREQKLKQTKTKQQDKNQTKQIEKPKNPCHNTSREQKKPLARKRTFVQRAFCHSNLN